MTCEEMERLLLAVDRSIEAALRELIADGVVN
jgi:hypothetical protein